MTEPNNYQPVSPEIKNFFEQFINSNRPNKIQTVNVNVGGSGSYQKGSEFLTPSRSSSDNFFSLSRTEMKKAGSEFSHGINSAAKNFGHGIISSAEKFSNKISESGGKFNDFMQSFTEKGSKFIENIPGRAGAMIGAAGESAGKAREAAYNVLTSTSPVGQMIGLAGNIMGKEGLDVPKIITSAFERSTKEQAAEVTKKLDEHKTATVEALKKVDVTDVGLTKEVKELKEQLKPIWSTGIELEKRNLDIQIADSDLNKKQWQAQEQNKKEEKSEKEEEKKQKKDKDDKPTPASVRAMAGAIGLAMIGKDFMTGGGLLNFASGNVAGGIGSLVFGETTDYYKKDKSGKYERDKNGDLISTGKGFMDGAGHVMGQALKFGAIGTALFGEQGGVIGAIVGGMIAAIQELWNKFLDPWFQKNVEPMLEYMKHFFGDVGKKGLLKAIVSPTKTNEQAMGQFTESLEKNNIVNDLSFSMSRYKNSWMRKQAEESVMIREGRNYKDTMKTLEENNASKEEIKAAKEEMNAKMTASIDEAINKMVEEYKKNGELQKTHNQALIDGIDKMSPKDKANALQQVGLSGGYDELIKLKDTILR